jgi:uncharacterized membrane protein YgdD (TMEM256/DUF423 family)
VSIPIRIAAAFGASGVILGAFGAHGLKSILAANEAMEIWRTASFYHLVHAVALLWVAEHYESRRWTFHCFALGILVFSGSLYALAVSNLKILGAVTPVGGLVLILGWSFMLFTRNRSKGV